MLASFAKSATNRLLYKKSSVNVHKRSLNNGSYQLQTPLADKLIASGGGRDSIKATLRQQIRVQTEEIDKGEKLYHDVPENMKTFQTLKNFLSSLSLSLDKKPEEFAEDDYQYLEIHGLGELINKYTKAFERLETSPLDLALPKELEEKRDLEVLLHALLNTSIIFSP